MAEETLAELLLLRRVRELVIAALDSPPSLHLFVVVVEILAEFLLLRRARVLIIAVLTLPPPPPNTHTYLSSLLLLIVPTLRLYVYAITYTLLFSYS